MVDRPPGAPWTAESTDGDLADAAAAGERGALEVLLDRHAERVHAVCRRVVGSAEDALDAAQEALVAIAQGIGRFDGRSAFSTWCYRVATNAALDELRRRGRRPTPTELVTESSVPGMEASVDARLDVDRALATIPEEFRVAVVLRDLADLDYPEIAAVLDVPLGTVKSRIARGRSALRARLVRADEGNQHVPTSVQGADDE
ncbi:MAG: RNA polymerase sigma factor [Acidimicrobiia bacterium]